MEKYFDAMASGIKVGKQDHLKRSRGIHHLLGVTNIDNLLNGPKLQGNGEQSVLCIVDGEVTVDDAVSPLEQKVNTGDKEIDGHESIPYLYKEYGLDFLKYLRGCFNIVIVDKEKNIYRIINSRFGLRVLYLAKIDGYLLFSSSLRSLMQCPLIDKSINKKAMIEYALFHYPLDNDTFFEEVKTLEPATVLTVEGSRITESRYWNQESLFGKKLLSVEDSIEGADYRLTRAVNRMHAGSARVGVSLTGGFDTRTILSLLDKDRKDILLYSFGKHTSGDMVVPDRISNLLGYDYYPIYLDGDYERCHFDKYAELAVMYSDGRSSIARAHYPYAFEQIGAQVKVVLTGICGSELLRPLSNVGTVISENIRVLYTNGVSAIREMLTDGRPLRYFRKPRTRDFSERIEGSVLGLKSFNERKLTLNQRLYVFILNEVLRKYFGPEIAMESPYVYNRVPFLDYAFVDFIFRTPFCGANFRFFTQNPLDRLRGQQFYAYLIDKHSAELARQVTDRKYSPRDLITKSGKIRAAMAYLLQHSRRTPSEDYGLVRGIKMFMSKNGDSILTGNEFVNTTRILDDFKNGYWTSNLVEFCKAVSFAFWQKLYLGNL
ncbi:MAG: hypothetical protein JSV53_03030 [candidate division WOR-3 bacterium]|nr:MAG: hypothetical protein JSV53_03030 [candidate division WOR-3 bacterium]